MLKPALKRISQLSIIIYVSINITCKPCGATCDINAESLVQQHTYLQGFQVWSHQVEGIGTCAKLCVRLTMCLSFNFVLSSKRCDLNNATLEDNTDRGVTRVASVYSRIKDWPETLDPDCHCRPCQLDEVCVPTSVAKYLSRCLKAVFNTAPSAPVDTNPPSAPADTNPPSAPADTNPPSAPADTNPPSVPADTNPPSAPADTNPPSAPADTNPPSAPADTNPPSAPADTNPPSAPADTNPPSAPADTNPPSAAVDTNPPSAPVDTNPPSAPVDTNPPTTMASAISTTRSTQTGGVSDCSAGWLNFQQSCYRFNTYPLQWDKAANNCTLFNAYLARIESQPENEFLTNKVKEFGGSFWTGGNDKESEGNWVWGHPNGYTMGEYDSWYDGEPNCNFHNDRFII